MAELDVERGRSFRAACGADLGDARCRVDLSAWTASGSVTAVTGPGRIEAALPGSVSENLFSGGRLAWTGGANAGRMAEIRLHAGVLLTLWEAPAAPIAPGDAFSVTAGCDKGLATCAGRFGNAANFQGFPHMPGNDFVIRPASAPGATLDGGSFFRD